MIIGIPKEIKAQEYRVGMVPSGVQQLVASGHTVVVEQGAGLGSGLSDAEYVSAGAVIEPSAAKVWSNADMIIKVKEPIASEYPHFKEGLLLYTYLHLAAVPELTKALLDAKVTGLAYETICVDGRLPLLKPMSEIAGKMSVQVGAYALQKENQGRGVLLGGVPGTSPADVVIIGGGSVGTSAAKIAVGMGARVTILDRSLERMTYLDDVFGGRLTTLYSNPATIAASVVKADLVVGAVLVAGARAPKLVTRALIAEMKEGAVVVDVSVDQGGCIETCHPTTHENPTYVVDGVVHYCVANMPGAVARTSTFALTNATTDYALMLANHGVADAVKHDDALRLGLNTLDGYCVHEAVATSLGYDYRDPLAVLG